MSRPDLTEQDVLRRMRKAMIAKPQQTCTHPTEHIRDLPDGSICRKCGESVPPLMRDKPGTVTVSGPKKMKLKLGEPGPPAPMDWMGRIPTRMGVFPSSGEE